MRNYIYFLLSILVLSFCAPPPSEPEPVKPAIVKSSEIIKKGDNNSTFKRLQSKGSSRLIIEDSKVSIYFYENYKTLENQLIVSLSNSNPDNSFTQWSFIIESGQPVSDVSHTCEIKKNGKNSGKVCTKSLDDSNSYGVVLNYEFSLEYNEKLYITYKYNLNRDSREILYFQESIIITPIIYSLPCDYKFIIPDGYKYIGTKNGYLTKESDRIYKFTGDCTSPINEILRFSPEKVWWKAMNEYSLETSTKFEDTVFLSFPRLYRGGKLKNANYEISSIDDEAFNEEDNIFNDNYLEVELQANDKAKVGVKIETTFLNNLNEEFKVYFPESHYKINLSAIDQTIIDKANEIINSEEYPGKPNYYKIGKFVNSYITYDSAFFGEDLTISDIYNGKRGVCEHYTLLYNAMLNAIGIKTVYISGWAFSNDQTSGNKNTDTHAWTGALINNKWIELDATWGLFEGIPAGHILKNFYNEMCYYSYFSNSEPTFQRNRNIQMITDNEELHKLQSLFNDNNNNNNDKGKKEDNSRFNELSIILMICFCLFSVF